MSLEETERAFKQLQELEGHVIAVKEAEQALRAALAARDGVILRLVDGGVCPVSIVAKHAGMSTQRIYQVAARSRLDVQPEGCKSD